MKTILIILLCCLFAVECSAGTFGRTTVGVTNEEIKNNILGLVVDMTSDVDQRADTITVYLVITGTAKKVKCALYDNTSPDRVLVAETEERTISASTGWQTFSFVDPPLLVADQEYLICAWSEVQTGYGRMRRDESNSNTSLEQRAETYNGFPNPFIELSSSSSDPSIYVTFGLGVTRLFEGTFYESTFH